MTWIRARIVMIGSLFTLACASYDYGPIKDVHFEDIVRASLGLSSEQLLLSGKAQLWHGRSAYDAQREWGGKYPKPLDGVLVLFETQMRLISWNAEAKQYRTDFSVQYEAIQNLRWDMHGVGKMVQFDAEGMAEKLTFTFIIGNVAPTYNWPRNTTAMKILGERAGSSFDLNAPVE